MRALEKAHELITFFDSISDYPVQCALKVARETYIALDAAGEINLFWRNVISILEHYHDD